MPILITCNNRNTEVLTRAIRQEQRRRETRLQIGKEEVKNVCLLATSNYIQETKDFSRNLLEPINEFSKVTGNPININILYYNNEMSEKEIKKMIPFILATNNKSKFD